MGKARLAGILHSPRGERQVIRLKRVVNGSGNSDAVLFSGVITPLDFANGENAVRSKQILALA